MTQSIEVLLLWDRPTETSFFSPLDTFFQYHLISSASTWNLPICQWRHWSGSGAPL